RRWCSHPLGRRAGRSEVPDPTILADPLDVYGMVDASLYVVDVRHDQTPVEETLEVVDHGSDVRFGLVVQDTEPLVDHEETGPDQAVDRRECDTGTDVDDEPLVATEGRDGLADILGEQFVHVEFLVVMDQVDGDTPVADQAEETVDRSLEVADVLLEQATNQAV